MRKKKKNYDKILEYIREKNLKTKKMKDTNSKYCQIMITTAKYT